jgi:aminopeptidase N
MQFRKLIKSWGNRTIAATIASLALLSVGTSWMNADEPYARSRDYDLEHSRIALRFDLEQKKIFGDVTHSVSVLRNGTDKISFDSVGLQIESVTLNRTKAKFATSDTKLNVALPKAAKPGEKFEIEIKYEGKPSKGIYFILPDKDYPNRPTQVWTQGESEDTRYYLPTYDYPNNRLTTETILTVPATWLTISNGKLVSVGDAKDGQKVWTWRESQPSSTYLFTVVAGDLSEVKDAWRDTPVTYYAPKDRGDRLSPNYKRTPAMIDLFSKKLGVEYPWEKYSQAMVDDFVAGGMENSSATTNTSSSLRHPQLVPEFLEDEDPLISHELGHQWFGDLVTCKDWGNIWLNEGFATYMETVWIEAHYGKDQADYQRWESSRQWFANTSLYSKPIVRRDFDDSSEFDGNAYGKGGLVLYMLRHKLGDEPFYAGLKHYLEVNRGKNVVTSDLVKAIEEATHTNVDEFFDQWVYNAGAPQFSLSYTYEPKNGVALTVTQTQKREGRVGLFRVPVEIEITNANGLRLYPVVVSKESETFTFPSDTAPKMVLFDKGNQILKKVVFNKDKQEWLYQLKNASEVADRADAAVALGKLKNDSEAVTALGEALQHDKNSGVRMTVANSLGELGGASAAKQLIDALAITNEAWVRAAIVRSLGKVKDDTTVAAKLESIAKEDHSYRARASALNALGQLKTPGAYETLTAAVKSDSPDDILRNAALRGLGILGDERAAALLAEWSKPGKNLDSREQAINGLARLQKTNKEITQQIAGYLSEPHFSVRMAAIFALGARGDASAVPALQALLKRDDLSIEMAPMIKEQIERLKNPLAKYNPHGEMGEEENPDSDNETAHANESDAKLNHLEQLVQEMNERLKSIEGRLPTPQK